MRSFKKSFVYFSVAVLMISAPFLGCSENNDSDIEYLALGASETSGIGADPLARGYPSRIQERLEDRGTDTDLTNLGIPGATIDQIRDTSFQVAKEKSSDLITMAFGANDLTKGTSPAAFEEDVQAIVQQLKEEHPNAFMVIGTIPDLTKFTRFVEDPDRDVTTQSIAAYNDAIIRIANANGVAIADFRNLQIDQEFTSSDGFHPSNEGYAIIAQKFLEVIEPHFFPARPTPTPAAQ